MDFTAFYCLGWYLTWCVLFLWQQINIDIYFCRRNSDICSSARLKTIRGHPPRAFDHVYDPRGGEFEPNTLLGHLYGQIYILRLQDRGIWWKFASQGRRYGEFGHQEWKKSNARGRPGGMCGYRFDSCIMVQIVSFVISSKLLWFTVCFQLHWSASATIFKQLYHHNKQFDISWKSQVLYEWNIVLMDNAQWQLLSWQIWSFRDQSFCKACKSCESPTSKISSTVSGWHPGAAITVGYKPVTLNP